MSSIKQLLVNQFHSSLFIILKLWTALPAYVTASVLQNASWTACKCAPGW